MSHGRAKGLCLGSSAGLLPFSALRSCLSTTSFCSVRSGLLKPALKLATTTPSVASVELCSKDAGARSFRPG